MHQQIGLREANQHFADYIEHVEHGDEFIITRHGQPVAKLIPFPIIEDKKLTAIQKNAWQRTFKRMQQGFDLGIKKIDRDKLHER